jgi:hypothetical protein
MRAWRPREATRGATALEFAFVAPLFIMILVMLFDLAILMFLSLTTQTALSRAARFGSTGAEPEAGDRIDGIRTVIETDTFGFLAARDLIIDVRSYGSFDEAAEAEWLIDRNANGLWDHGESFDDVDGDGGWSGDAGALGPGAADQVAVYRVSAEYRFMTPVLGAALGPVAIRAAAPVRNEPFRARPTD